MKAEIKERWLLALESGDYKQSTGQLKRGDRFCCLGVLCDLHADETGGNWEHHRAPHKTNDPDLAYHAVTYKGIEGVLPDAVIDWADAPNDDPTVYLTEQDIREIVSMGKNTEVNEQLILKYMQRLRDEQPISNGAMQIKLSALNDDGLSFEQMAEVIRRKL